MLTLDETPKEIALIYRTYKDQGALLFAALQQRAQREKLKANVDLFEHARGRVVYIEEGYFKLTRDSRIIRLYSEGDFVVAKRADDDFALRSDFVSEIALFEWASFLETLGREPVLLEKWVTLLSLETEIDLGLCATFIHEKPRPDIEIRQLKTGDDIIVQGSDPTEIYEMMMGTASVEVDEVPVGTIYQGEIFGEMSFLAGCPRTATVRANGPCLVRVVKKEDFKAIIETDVHLSAAISKTLAERVVELNQKVVVNRV